MCGTDAISRSAVIDRIAEFLGPQGLDEWEVMVAIREIVENAPALDVEPVIHATWIEDGYYEKPCVCSRCGEEAHYTSTFREQFDYDWDENLVPCGYEEIREYIKSNRCPECGARMDGEAE